LRSSIMLRIAQEIKFRKNEAHVIDYYNYVQSRLEEACIGSSHVKELSQ